MRELNRGDETHRHRALFRFVLGNAQIFAAGLGAAFLIHTGPTSWWTIATVSVGAALVCISLIARHIERREPGIHR